MGYFRKDWLSSEICIILLLLLHTVLLSATLNSFSTGTDADSDHKKLVTLHIIVIIPITDEVDCSTSFIHSSRTDSRKFSTIPWPQACSRSSQHSTV